MKRRVITRFILAGVILFAQYGSSLRGSPIDATAGEQSFAGDISCPDVGVNITFVNVTPETPAQQHVVNLTWTASKPSCFTFSTFKVSGVVTFENGQTRNFETSVPGTQQAAHIPFPGILETKPRKVTVKVGATATGAITGSAIFPAPSPSLVGSGPCTVTLQVTQAVMSGLVPAPNRPGDFHPKIKVQWQTTNLPACQRINQFKVEGELVFKGKVNSFSQTVPGTPDSTEITLTSIAVGSTFAPESIKARVTATGESKITGVTQKEASAN